METHLSVALEGLEQEAVLDPTRPHLDPEQPLGAATAVVGVGGVQDEQHQQVDDLTTRC